MRKIIYILGLLTMCFFTSCSDDFLDRDPKVELSDASYWKTPLDAEMFVADLYRFLPSYSSEIDWEVYSDNALHGIKWSPSEVIRGVYDPGDTKIRTWSPCYEAIRKANVLLEKIELIPNYETSAKAKVQAEARFFRGLKHFELIRRFGDVPYLDKALTLTESAKVTRTPYETVYTKIMEDLDSAIKYLPTRSERPVGEYGRVTKGAAAAIKARVALYYGYKITGAWETAAAAALLVMNSGEYELLDKDGSQGIYHELFWEKQEACSEIILSRQYKNPGLANGLIGWHAFPSVGWGGINPTQGLVDAFECTDGGTIKQSNLYNKKTPFENRDPRCDATILHHGEVRWGKTIKIPPASENKPTGISTDGDATETGYYNDKFMDTNLAEALVWDGSQDQIVVRFAEVLLTYAEAKNKVTPLDPSALAAVNRVRARVKMPALQTTDNTKFTYVANGDDLDKRIRNEWRVEYAMEGKRVWDIRRWGIAEEVMNTYPMRVAMTQNADGSYTMYEGEPEAIISYGLTRYKPHNYIWPIPQNELDLNPGLGKPPGY